ncbi:MAG: cytochrome c3 family protein, partial [Elusimicrobiota bacterium]
HTTGTPTKEKPALIQCPRAKVQGFHAIDEAVRNVTFPGKGEYGPVKFSHRAHAEMAEMGESCGSCHHYNQARSIQECRECHSPERLRDGDALGKPDLPGARHRLCISCHRSWDGDAKCGSCHEVKGRPRQTRPRMRTPDRAIYALSSREKVDFPHRDHVVTYGLKCVECHKGSTCAECHSSFPVVKVAPSACVKCHAGGVPGKRR